MALSVMQPGASISRLQRAAAENHKVLFRTQAIGDGGEERRLGGLVWTYSGPNQPSQVGFPMLAPDQADEALDGLIAAYLKEPPSGAGCWSLDPSYPSDLGLRLLARGFQPGWRPHWQGLDLHDLKEDHLFPPGLELVADHQTDVATIPDLPYADQSFGATMHQAASGHMLRYLARINGKIVGHCGILYTEGDFGVAGVYHVGVVPSYRQKGIGKALVVACCAQARSLGYRYALLNGTGEKMYSQVGFKSLGKGFTWWLKMPRFLADPPTPERVALAEAVGRSHVFLLEEINPDLSELMRPLTNGMTLMQLAVHLGRVASVNYLMKRGVPLSVLSAWDLGWKEKAAELLKTAPGLANDVYGDASITLLHIAVERRDKELARLALDAGVDLSIRDTAFKSTALGWADHLGSLEIGAMIRASLG
jgi:GNAT superfamily N-acetyltransferase